MPTVDEADSHPGPVSTNDPGTPITLPAATSAGPAQVPTGFPHTPQGAMAQLAAIDQTALQSGTLAGAREVIAGWAMPGGPDHQQLVGRAGHGASSSTRPGCPAAATTSSRSCSRR